MGQDRLHRGVARNIQLIILLQSRDGYKVDELATKLNVSRRTIFRDLRQLAESGYPFDLDPETGRYRLSEIQPISLAGGASWRDLLTVAAAALSSPWMNDKTAQHKIREAVTRILSDAPKDHRNRVNKALGSMERHAWESISPRFAEELLTILTAIGNGQLFKISGVPDTGPAKFPLRVIPKAIELHHQTWILIGESVLDGRRCVFELSRCLPTEDVVEDQEHASMSGADAIA